jgi:LacI family transcriptional regulator
MPPNKEKICIALVNDGTFHHGREILMGAKNWCVRHGNIRTRIFANSVAHFKSHPEVLSEGAPFDVAITFAANKELVDLLRKVSSRIVNTCTETICADLPSIETDDFAIGKEAANYYLRRKYTSFAHISKASKIWSVQRNAGFTKQIEEAGHHSVAIEWNESGASYQQLVGLPRPLAVFAPSDPIARGTIERILDHGVHVPRDISVLGVDDDPYQNALCSIPLSSVRLPGHRVGELAAEMAYSWICNNKTPPMMTGLKPIDVVTRLSTDHAFCDDELVADALELISENIKELTCTDDLVSRLKKPRRTLEWHFRKELGHSIHEELSHARIENARKLLATTPLTCEEVAHKVGLSEGRILTLLFKRKLGITPSQYRGHTT